MYFSIRSPCCPRDYTAISLSSQQKCGSFATALGVFAVSVLAPSGSWHIIRSGRFRISQIAVGKTEIILKELCRQRGEPSPVRSNHIVKEKSIIRPSKGIYSHILHMSKAFHPLQRRRPVHIPNPPFASSSGSREPTVHFHRTPYLAHKPASRPPSHRCGSPPRLSRPDASIASPLRLSVRVDRAPIPPVLHPVLSGGACGITIPPPIQLPRRRSTIFADVVCSLSRPPGSPFSQGGWERKQRLVSEGTAPHTERSPRSLHRGGLGDGRPGDRDAGGFCCGGDLKRV